MIIPRDTKIEIKCVCGKKTITEFKLSKLGYCEFTDFTCPECNREYDIIDYTNGCTSYMEKK